MFAFLALVASLAASAAAQATSFEQATGVRSLWIPYQTFSGAPLASIASNSSHANVTVYVLSCPTAQPQCAIAPNLTLTEGISMVQYGVAQTSGGADAHISCDLTGTTSAICHARSEQGGQIATTDSTLAASDINYVAVSVTSTNNNTATMPVTVTVTPSPSSSSTSSSIAGATPMTANGPWAMGGAIGAGLVALAAL